MAQRGIQVTVNEENLIKLASGDQKFRQLLADIIIETLIEKFEDDNPPWVEFESTAN